jgi:SAM-dependent methyltransferase
VSWNKPDSYFRADRTGFLNWIDGHWRRVLEIGCGTGGTAPWLRAHGAQEIVGVEPDERAAAEASKSFDRVFPMTVEGALSRLGTTPFDLIICADVLEHLVDPWATVSALRGVSDSSTRLAVSIPNVRYFKALWEIGFGRGFAYPLDGTYDPQSIFDTTHLRFFARSNVKDMLESGGWVAERWGIPPRRRLVTLRNSVDSLSRGWLREYMTYQWYVISTPHQDERP